MKVSTLWRLDHIQISADSNALQKEVKIIYTVVNFSAFCSPIYTCFLLHKARKQNKRNKKETKENKSKQNKTKNKQTNKTKQKGSLSKESNSVCSHALSNILKVFIPYNTHFFRLLLLLFCLFVCCFVCLFVVLFVLFCFWIAEQD